MSLSNLLKKASEIFTGSNSQDVSHPVYQDGETIFCKNNVCVHPASILREDYDLVHHPGYLTIHYTSTRSVPGLHLVWVPNTSLHKNTTLENYRRSQSLNRYDQPDAQCDSPQRGRRPRCLSHTRRDSLESQCSGCSPSVDNISFSSIDSCNEVVRNECVNETEKADGVVKTNCKHEAVETADSANKVVTSDGNGDLLKTADSDMETVRNNKKNEAFGAISNPNAFYSSEPKSLLTNISLPNSKIGTPMSTVAIQSPLHNSNVNCMTNASTNFTNPERVTEILDQTTNQNQVHQHKNGPVQSDQTSISINNQTRRNNHISTKEKQCHISSHSQTKCQTNETVPLPSKPIMSKPCAENSTVVLVENNVKCTVENSSKPNVNVIKPTPQYKFNGTISKGTEEKVTENTSCKPLLEIHSAEESISKCELTLDGRNVDSSNHSQENVSTMNNENSNITPIIRNTTEDDRERIEIRYNNNSSFQCNTTNESFQSINNKADNPDDDTEELEIFNINKTVHQLPNGTKPTSTGRKVSTQSPKQEAIRSANSLRNSSVFQTQNQSLPCSPYLSRSKKSCRKFSIELNEMKSLRLFFCDVAKTRGQFVIASRESQYKILHFHHGGLNKLAKLLNEWNFVKTHSNQPGEVLPYEHFMVYQPTVPDSELHPDENTFPNHVDILSFFNAAGQIEDELGFRRYIFFNGVPPKHRSLVWPFLLNYYAYNTTREEREAIVRCKRQEYASIAEKRHSLGDKKREEFERGVESVVEKDVVRTDRGNPFYAGHGNPHIEIMKNILLNYAVYDAGLGYTQGMSDLLAPVLAEIRTEPDVFWCFTGLLRRGLFVCTPTDSDMEQNLNYFRELMRLMEPKFYEHLTKHVDAMELLFCHRWILLCFKREFQTENALSIWESCWSSYATEYFHLFVCLAIVSVYGTDVIAQNLRTDEMLLHFSSLANYMDAKLILRKARGLVHNFRQLSVIPCTLVRLCQQCGPGIWDSSHVPAVVCQNASDCDCAYRNTD